MRVLCSCLLGSKDLVIYADGAGPGEGPYDRETRGEVCMSGEAIRKYSNEA